MLQRSDSHQLAYQRLPGGQSLIPRADKGPSP